MVRGFNPLRKSTCDYSLIFSCGVEQRQLVGLITQRSTVRVRPPRPENKIYNSLGSSSIMEQPVTISNTEVKHFSADDTAFMWENKSPPRDKNNKQIVKIERFLMKEISNYEQYRRNPI